MSVIGAIAMNSSEDQVCARTDQGHIVLTINNVSSYLYSQVDTTVICIIMPVILTIGVVSNGAFLLVIARVGWMRQVSSNIYLACLAGVDITFLAAAVGGRLSRFLASPIVIDDSVLGVSGCMSLYFLSDMCLFVSLFLITLISLERYYAVCRPFAFKRNSNTGRALPVVGKLAGCWLAGTVCASFLIPDRSAWRETCISGVPPEDFEFLPLIVGQCTSIVDWYSDFSTGVQVVPFFATMFVNFTLYGLIARKLRQQAHARRGQDSAAARDQVRIRDQITRMLIINGATYFVCLVPFEAVVLSYLITSIHGLPPVLTPDQSSLTRNICRCFLYVNSAINPFIYTVTSPAYRRAFVEGLSFSKNRTDSSTGLVDLSNLHQPTAQDNGRRQ